MPEKTFEAVAVYSVMPGCEGQVLEQLDLLAQASREEEGNLRYEYFQGVEDPLTIVILESYRSADDFQVHRNSTHFQQIGVGRIIPLLSNRTVSTYDSPTR